MGLAELIAEYQAGPRLLRDALAGLTPEQLRDQPIPGRWSTRQVVLHLADAEAMYADRMKRVLAEDEPLLAPAVPDEWVSRLAYDRRELEEELTLIELIRSQMSRILLSLQPADFRRRGVHPARGPMTLEEILRRATDHIPHHVRFIEEKRRAMGAVR